MKFAIASLFHGHNDSLVPPIATHDAAGTFFVILSLVQFLSAAASMSLLLALIGSHTRPSPCSCNIFDVPSLIPSGAGWVHKFGTTTRGQFFGGERLKKYSIAR